MGVWGPLQVFTCKKYTKRYFGKTALSSFERGLNHGNDLKAGKEDSHILKHKSIKHPNEEVTFSMKIVKRHPTCFQRLCHESVLIEMNENCNILNSKNSFNRAAIPRLAIMVSDKVIIISKKVQRQI